MKIKPHLLMILLAAAGTAVALVGVYLQFGGDATMIVGGSATAAVALMADV